MASSNSVEGPLTPSRKSRRSWFDTPPLTTLDPKPKENKKPKPSSKRRSLDTVESLTLTHFTSAPRLGFGNAITGTTKFRTLLIRNPHEYEQEVIIEKFPFKKKFYVEHTRFTVAAGEVFSLEIHWTPEEASGVREMIQFHIDGTYRLQCFVFGVAENPKPVKKIRRGKFGPRANQNSFVVQTPALTRIKSSYSPRRSQEIRELQALVENKEIQHNNIRPDNNETLKINDPLHYDETAKCYELNVHHSENQENVRPSHVSLTPTPLESTCIGIGLKRGREPSADAQRKKLTDNSSPNLTTMSPIPMSDGNENGITIDSFFRASEIGFDKISSGSNMKDTFVVPKAPFLDLDSPSRQSKPTKVNNLTTVVYQENKVTTCNTTTVLSGQFSSQSESKSVLSPSIMEVKKRSEWHTPDKNNSVLLPEECSSVSPNTILDQSLSLIAQISTPVEDRDRELISSDDQSLSITNSFMSQGKGLVSPNSFMEDMKKMAGNDAGDIDNFSSGEKMLSPSAIVNCSISHNVVLEHLSSVCSSLNNSPCIQTRSRVKRRSFTTAYRASEKEKNIFKVKKSPKLVDRKPRRSSGRIARDGCGKLTEKQSFVDSPRRKGPGGKKISPFKKQMLLSKADFLRKSQRNKRLSAAGKCSSPLKSNRCSKSKPSTPFKQSSCAIDSGTVIKNRSYTSESSSSISLPNSEDTTFSPISCCLPNNSSEMNLSHQRSSTVTKSRPSDALLISESNKCKKLFTENESSQRYSPQDHNSSSKTDKEIEFHTPTNLPTSPKPENSRRSTHVIKSPKMLDLMTLQKKCLNFAGPEMDLHDTDHPLKAISMKQESCPVDPPITAVCAMSPQIVDYEVTSEGSSQRSSVLVDSLETSQCSDSSFNLNAKSTDQVQRPVIEDTKSDLFGTFVLNQTKSITCVSNEEQEFKVWDDYAVKSGNKANTSSVVMDTMPSDLGFKCKFENEIHNSLEGLASEENIVDLKTVDHISTTRFCPEKSSASQELKAKKKVRRSASANELLSSVFNMDISEIQKVVQDHDRLQSVVPTLPRDRRFANEMNCQKAAAKATTSLGDRYVKTAENQLPVHKTKKEGNLRKLQGISQSLTNVSNLSSLKNNRQKQNQRIPTKAVHGSESSSTCLKSGVKKPKKGPVKGLAQSKLILVKKSKSAVARHPMPFAARNMYYDERWMEKQEKGFVQWLNFVLTPPEEYVAVTSKQKVDAAALTLGNQHVHARLAPTKEVLSFRAYAARRRLNRLRRAACQLYQSDALVPVIKKVESEVESRRIAVRKDRMLHADLGIKQRMLDLLLQYSSLWLRIGLETIFGEVIMLQSNTDMIGLSRFIVTRLLSCPDIAAQYAHPSVPHLYSEGFAPALSRHTIKKFLLLVFFLDKAKSSRLIDHDPCLFCKDADIKASKEILIQFSREVLSGEGDLTRHLAYLGYTVSQVQKPFDEFDYAVTNLSGDLRDGLRLCRVLELLGGDSEVMKKLRTPAISRLQKIHNTEIFFSAMKKRDMNLEEYSGTSARDVVDGHREKTLALLWHLILHFQANVNVDEAKVKEEIGLLTKSLRLKLAMQKIGAGLFDDCQARRDSGESNIFLNSERMQLIFKWCRLVCLHYGVKIENMTVSFSDGRALCCLLHHYHPALLPLSEIKFETSIQFQEKAEEQCDGEDPDLSVDWGKKGGLFPKEDDPEYFGQLLKNEKSNFKVLYEKVSALGGVPLMIKHSDMSNTIPDEKVVTTYVSYLCARLLDIREEVRAARIIQMTWRKWRLQRTFRQRKSAVVVIQRSYRSYLKRKRFREQVEMEERLQKMEVAAAKLQTFFRSYKERQCFLRAKCAIISVQSLWRMKKAKAEVFKMKELLVREREEERNKTEKKAAIVIQKTFKGFVARQKLKQEISRVIILQSLWRMQKARSILKVKKAEKRVRLEKMAATQIQKVFRGHMARNEFLHVRNCTLILQSLWRMQKARSILKVKKEEKRVRLENMAATQIQKVFRGHRARNEFLHVKNCTLILQSLWRMQKARSIVKVKKVRLENMAATQIQKVFRGHMARNEFLHVRNCTLILQSLWRMQQAKALVSEMKIIRDTEAKKKRELEAVITIQKKYKGYKTRKNMEYLTKCTIVVQSLWRMQKAKNELNFMKLEKLRVEKESQAALKIQKIFRGFIYRKEMKILRRCTVQIQALWRMKLARLYVLKLKSEKARRERELKLQQESAVKIQKVFRGFQERRKWMVMKECAIVLQCFWRVQMAKQAATVKREKRERSLLENKSAIVIQSLVRGWICRTEIVKLHNSATCIQKMWRGYLSCKRVILLRKEIQENSAVTIQKCIKGWFYRRMFVEKRVAALRIQSWWREVLVLEVLKEEARRFRAAVAIQICYRGYKCRQEYERLKRACICLQCAWRVRAAKTALQVLKIRKREKAAEVIYKTVLAYFHRTAFLKRRSASVVIQKHWKMVIAKRQLEELRTQKMNSAALCIQINFKAFIKRQEYLRLKQCTLTLQSAWRCFTARQQLCELKINRVEKSAFQLQACVKGWLQRKCFLKLKDAAIVLQKTWRMKKAQQEFKKRKIEKDMESAIIVQKYWKGFCVRKRYDEIRHCAIFVQAQWRMIKERRNYNNVKRSVINMQLLYKTLKEGKQQRENYLQLKSATICFQRAFRELKKKRDEQCKQEAAICLQKNWRCFKQRMRFLALRYATITIQQAFREHCLKKQAVKDLIEMQNAAIVLQLLFKRNLKMKQDHYAIVIQTAFRGYIAQKKFNRERLAALLIQRWVRSIQMMESNRALYQQKKFSAVKIQTCFRMYTARKNFMQKKEAVVKLQAFYRRIHVEEQFQMKKNAAIVLQMYFRAWKLGKVFHEAFLLIKNSCIVIQRFYRRQSAKKARARLISFENAAATKLQACYKCHRQRNRYLALKSATLFVQRTQRSIKMGQVVREELKTQRSAVITIQRAWRQVVLIRKANLMLEEKRQEFKRREKERMEEERRKEEEKNITLAVFTLQKAWKQFQVIRHAKMILAEKREARRIEEQKKEKERQREEQMKVLNAVSVIKTAWKQMKLIREAKEILHRKREQARIEEEERAALLRLSHRQNTAALKCQAWYRMLTQRQKYLALKNATVLVQRKFRGVLLVRAVKSEIEEQKSAALIIQRWWRESRQIREAKVILERLKEDARKAEEKEKWMEEERKRVKEKVYKEVELNAVKVLQRHARSFLFRVRERRRITAALLIQAWYRKRCQERREKAATQIQALWRGFIARQRNTSKKLKQARKRLEEANRSENTNGTLGSRMSSALEYLLTNKDLSYILTTLMHLEVATRLSPVCCERLAETDAVSILVCLLSSCNRSVPHMEIIKYTIETLLNLAKYEKTVGSLMCVSHLGGVIVELMQIYREKGVIFLKSCTLLGILARDPQRRLAIKTTASIGERIQSIHSLVVRKHRTSTKQQVTAARFNAMKSFNCTLPVATPTKKKQRAIRPDWVLSKDNAKEFKDPLTAINFVMSCLQLEPK